MKLRIRNFDYGLAVDPSEDKIPDSALVRARGIQRLPRGYIASRAGSTQLHAVNAQAGIHYWNSRWFYGTSNSLYIGSTCASSGTYTGSRLTFLPAAPTAGMPEVLFVAGGSTTTLRKINSTDTISNWGIAPPPETLVVASGGTTGELTTGAVYHYRLSYYNINTGSRSNPTAIPTTYGYSGNTVLLLHGDGAHAATGFADSAGGHTVTTTGAAALSTATPKLGTACMAFGTSDDYASIAASPDFSFSTAPFTIDFWARFSTFTPTQTYGIIGQYTTTDANWAFYAAPEATASWFLLGVNGVIPNAGSWLTGTTVAITTGTWYHFAIIRGWNNDPDTFAITLNGNMLTMPLTTGINMPDLNAPLEIGRIKWSTTPDIYGLPGAIDELRIIKGIAAWTANFTPTTVSYGQTYFAGTSVDKAVALSGITSSTDSQVTHNEIWRTAANGSAYYLVTRVPASQSTYLDKNADADLGLEELPEDNLKPYAWFDDCIVYNASMFWITRTQTGELGRLYYSPVGRAEAVQGYINITDDSDPLQRLVLYGTAIGVFSKGGFFEILGTNPYYSRQVHGVPGTLEPYSVCVTPYGIAYEATDGPRLLVGNQAALLSADRVTSIFQGEARSNLVAWSTGTYGAYAREEYLLSNVGSTQSLAVNLRTGRWRDLGLPLGPLHYAPTADILAAHYTTGSAVYTIEKEGETDDSGTAISFSIETKHYADSGAQRILVRGIHVDAKTGSTSLAATLVYDSTTLALASVSATSRTVTELPCGKWVREFGVRLGNSLSNSVEVYGIDIDVYAPQEVSE